MGGYPDSDNMWVDKDDVFADDKVQEFKTSNPESETHIRSISSAKSLYPSTPTLSHLLYQHTLSYMSSDRNNELAYEYPTGAIADSPVPLSQEYLSTPLSMSTPPSPSLISTPSRNSVPLPQPLFLDLSLPPHLHLKSPLCSDSSGSTPLPLLHPMVSTSQNKPTKCLLFCSPLPKGEGIAQALAWNCKQLLDLR
jgi:hypothetical protein